MVINTSLRDKRSVRLIIYNRAALVSLVNIEICLGDKNLAAAE